MRTRRPEARGGQFFASGGNELSKNATLSASQNHPAGGCAKGQRRHADSSNRNRVQSGVVEPRSRSISSQTELIEARHAVFLEDLNTRPAAIPAEQQNHVTVPGNRTTYPHRGGV